MNSSKLVTLKTPRLSLRPFREEDWLDVHEYAVDPLISEFQEWGPNSEKDTISFVRRCMKAAEDENALSNFFSIALPQNDQHIGGCVLTLRPQNPGTASIGYTIGRSYWNNGFATEAALALVKFGFEIMDLMIICADCDAANVASWRVMEKIGMRLAHVEKNARYFKARWRDWREYQITNDDWHRNIAKVKSLS